MSGQSFEEQPTHKVFSEMGKRVLRPGGRDVTLELVDALDISSDDDVVEFAPGMGQTAEYVLEQDPNSYTAVEIDREAASRLADEIEGPDRRVVVGHAGATDLDSSSADVVIGEAMLTMQPDDGKAEIVREANRLLRSGGSYGIHEFALRPDDIDEETKSRIRDDLSQVAQVDPRPLTAKRWVEILASAGFDEVWRTRAPMDLLEPRRVISDEGLLGALRFGLNVATTPSARQRIRRMRAISERYGDHLEAIAIVAKSEK
ncbi:MAG: class I SAM-dependent methyltransferase [Halanaeroarchaeum sp.]